MNGLVLITVDEFKKILRSEIDEALEIKKGFQSEKDYNKKFSLPEAAEYVGLPVPSFRIHQHKIGGVKIGKKWKFAKDELDRFIEANRRSAI